MIRSGSRKMRRRRRSQITCWASVRRAWPRLANWFWRRRLVVCVCRRKLDLTLRAPGEGEPPHARCRLSIAGVERGPSPRPSPRKNGERERSCCAAILKTFNDKQNEETPMKAAVLMEVNKPLVIEDVSLPKPGPREVLIRTSVAGLCHSDLHFMEGLYPHPLPAVLGHESAGVVEQVGSDVNYVKPGDHVVTCLSVFCGTCDNCTTGRTVLCTDTTVKMLPGASNRLSWARSEKLNQFLNLSSFAEQMLVHENAIVKIRKDMPLDLAALIGCGVITGFGAVVNTAKVRPGETVVVIGCGGVGRSEER